jgi:hypothetical protein
VDARIRILSLTTVIDVATRENWSRNVMFRDLFSSSTRGPG